MVLYHMNMQNQNVFKNLIWLVVDYFHPSKLELELSSAKFYAPLLIDKVWYRLWDLDLLNKPCSSFTMQGVIFHRTSVEMSRNAQMQVPLFLGTVGSSGPH